MRRRQRPSLQSPPALVLPLQVGSPAAFNRQAPAWATLEEIARAGGQGEDLAGFARRPGEAVPAQEAGRPRAPFPPSAEYLSLKELVAYSGLSERTLRGYLHRRAQPLPHYRVAKKILVRRSEFDGWLAQFRRADGGDGIDSMVEEILSGLIWPKGGPPA